jgi:hypothetical protein
VGSTIHIAGAIIASIGCLFILVSAFQKSTGWGVAMLLLGPVLWPFFVFGNWRDCSYWFFFALVGFVLMYVF